MSFGIYLVGIVLFISGLVYAASIMNAPAEWIVVGTLVMLGAGVIAAVKNTRQRVAGEQIASPRRPHSQKKTARQRPAASLFTWGSRV